MHKDLKFTLSFLFCFCLFFLTNEFWFTGIYGFLNETIQQSEVSFFLAYLIVGSPLFLFIALTEKIEAISILGLTGPIIKALGVTFLFTLPMLLGYAYFNYSEFGINSRTFWMGCVFAALFEELYYRAFLFGLLFRKTKLGFIPAVLAGALVFASLHLYQSTDPGVLIGVFLTTLLGAAFFSWLYVEWDFNLWIPMGMHFFMNLHWELFSVSDHALGDLTANLIRSITIALAIAGTIIYKKKTDQKFYLTREKLFLSK